MFSTCANIQFLDLLAKYFLFFFLDFASNKNGNENPEPFKDTNKDIATIKCQRFIEISFEFTHKT